MPATRFSVRAPSAVRLRRCILSMTCSVHLVFGTVALQLSLVIVPTEVRGDCAIHVWKSIIATVLADLSGIVLW